MDIRDLPEEINILIIKLLDIQSQQSVYNTCRYFKNLISTYGVVTSCKFCMNVMATANSLKLDFFKDIAGHLQELNLSTICDLNRTSLLPAVKKLKKLKTLDVSYTKINITDLLDVFQVCPTIKDVSINFVFDKSVKVKVPQNIIIKCQNMFQHFERVNFFGTLINLFCSKLPLSMLSTAKLNQLQFTITDCAYLGLSYESTTDIDEMIKFRLLKVFLLNWHKDNQYYGRLNDSALLSLVDFSKYELIIISRCTMDELQVMVTHRFKGFFEKHFGVKPEVILTTWTRHELSGNVAFMIWNTESTVFDDYFFTRLSHQLNQFFPYLVTSVNSKTPVPAKNDWLYTKPNQHDFGRSERRIEPEFKRKRLAPQTVILNYDNVCKDKKKIIFSFVFDDPIRYPVTLSSRSTYLTKITHLTLSGTVIVDPSFFMTLFMNCNNLVAINCTISPNCSQLLGRHIPFCKYIKHLRLATTTIDFKLLFGSLSQCRYMENVHLHNMTSTGNITEPREMFERCFRMYNLSICMPMSDTLKVKKLQMLNKVKSMYSRDHLNIELCTSPDTKAFGYDPFVDVFKVNPIKAI